MRSKDGPAAGGPHFAGGAGFWLERLEWELRLMSLSLDNYIGRSKARTSINFARAYERSRRSPALGLVLKKLTDFFNQNLLQLIELERFLY